MTVTVAVDLAVINCGSCSGVYGITEKVREYHHQKGTSWHCPYCQCGWGYAGTGENSILKKQLAEANERARVAECRVRHAAAAEAQRYRDGKLKQCPHCPGKYMGLASHIKRKHKR